MSIKITKEKVGVIVGPFNFVARHVHAIPHIKGKKKKLEPHEHPVSVKLHFQAVSPDKPSFLDIHATRESLENKLRALIEGRTFKKPFEQVVSDLSGTINRWIPEFCREFSLEQSFFLAELGMDVTTKNDALHHAEGTTQYYVLTRAIGG